MSSIVNIVYYIVTCFWQVMKDVLSIDLIGYRYKRFKSLSPETRNQVLEIITILKNQEKKPDSVANNVADNARNDKSVMSVKDLIAALPCEEDLLAVTDVSGFNLLQHAVLCQDTRTVKCLLRMGIDPDRALCSSSLQMATRQGHEDMVKLLIDFKASSHKSGGMCYPKPHDPIFYRANYLGISPQAVYECNSRKRTPIQCAIDGDQVDIMKYLFNIQPSKYRYQTPPSELLQYSCKVGSLKCMRYLLTAWPELIEEKDSNGDTPLLLAIPWGQEYAQCLIENGADIRVRSQNGETVLHRLYRETKDGYYSIFNTTKFLLSSGLEEDVNVKDAREETPLHILVTHLSFVLGSVSEETHASMEKVQFDYQKEVVACMDLLLSYNANVHVINGENHGPLSKLLHITFITCYGENHHPCFSIDPVYHYENSFQILNKALEVLLRHGADPNVQCSAGHTSLVLLLRCLLYEFPEAICAQAEDFVDCLRTLLSHGAITNFVTSSDVTTSTLLAKIGQRYFKLGGSERNEDLAVQEQFCELVNSCLRLMLEYGLNPNHTTTKKCRHLQGGTGNALIEFVRLAEHVSTPRELIAIQKWLRTLMQWGADPDIEPYPSDPIICHSQSSIFLKKQASQPVSHYIHEAKELQSIFAQGHALELLLLFYSTMDHQILYECLRSAKFMSRFYPMGATGQLFLEKLNELTDNPRSLKNCVRVAIYKSLNRSLAEKVPKLPLPTPLKNYLLDIEL